MSHALHSQEKATLMIKSTRLARIAVLAAGTALMLGGSVGPAYVQPVTTQQGPASVADLAQKLIGAVVNISTSQTVKGGEDGDDQGDDDQPDDHEGDHVTTLGLLRVADMRICPPR